MADETTNSICGQSEGSHDGQLNESVNNEANGVQGGLTTGQICKKDFILQNQVHVFRSY